MKYVTSCVFIPLEWTTVEPSLLKLCLEIKINEFVKFVKSADGISCNFEEVSATLTRHNDVLWFRRSDDSKLNLTVDNYKLISLELVDLTKYFSPLLNRKYFLQFFYFVLHVNIFLSVVN